ncbi:MAG TPA: hypothetical protein ENF38_01115 [Candidatus Aenigmarchaeota archaeon]|nr:hypothetical protein [Candidatus Aenigmarchaeota archaeon]
MMNDFITTLENLKNMEGRTIIYHCSGDIFGYKYVAGRIEKVKPSKETNSFALVLKPPIIYSQVKPEIDFIKKVIRIYDEKSEEEREKIREIDAKNFVQELCEESLKRLKEGRYILQEGERLTKPKKGEISYCELYLRVELQEVEGIEAIE